MMHCLVKSDSLIEVYMLKKTDKCLDVEKNIVYQIFVLSWEFSTIQFSFVTRVYNLVVDF